MSLGKDITHEEVTNHIDTYILNSSVYDSATDVLKLKAYNQAKLMLPDFISLEKLTVRDVADQVVFLFMIDSTIQRADLGVKFITVDGIQMTIDDKERTLAPSIMRRHEIYSTKPARAGKYHTPLSSTFRYGNGGR